MHKSRKDVLRRTIYDRNIHDRKGRNAVKELAFYILGVLTVLGVMGLSRLISKIRCYNALVYELDKDIDAFIKWKEDQTINRVDKV